MINIVTTAARMATSSPISGDKNAERRSRVHLGPLPSGFLQPTPQPMTAEEQREAADRQAAVALQRQYCETPLPQAGQITGRLSITLVQAKLVKNYGMTRMDPYVRLRVGHCIYETHTDPNGGKTPRWNKVIHCLLPSGVTSIYLEIFDECSFTMDELIAWTHITIPQPVLQGETHEDWYPLNGKQGDGMEGMINLVLSYGTDAAQTFMLVSRSSFHPNHSSVYNKDDLWNELWPSWRGFGAYRSPLHVPRLSFMTAPIQMSYAPAVAYPPVVMVPNTAMGFAPMAVYPAQPAQAPAPPPPAPVLSEEELKQIEEMFPSIDKEVIKTVFEANRGNKDGTINSLLQMSE